MLRLSEDWARVSRGRAGGALDTDGLRASCRLQGSGVLGARGAGAALGRPELRCQTSVSVSGAGAGRVQRAERGGLGGRRKKKGRERRRR